MSGDLDTNTHGLRLLGIIEKSVRYENLSRRLYIINMYTKRLFRATMVYYNP